MLSSDNKKVQFWRETPNSGIIELGVGGFWKKSLPPMGDFFQKSVCSFALVKPYLTALLQLLVWPFSNT